jgi:TatD DNase family protein
MQPDALVDIGINLAHDSYDADRAAVVARALAASVGRMVVTGSSLESAVAAIRICQQWPQLMRATAGECGLDYFRDFSPRDDQRRAFAAQLELAASLHMPVFLHQRDAHADFMAILSDYLPRLPRAVVHCFTGSGAELADYLSRDLYVGITGWICDERRGTGVLELLREIPLGRLMIETDGPYLLPRNVQPRPAHRRNEPMYLRQVFAALCRARPEDPLQIAAATRGNALEFFGLPPMEPVAPP